MPFFKANKTTTTTVTESVYIETDVEELAPRLGFFARMFGGGNRELSYQHSAPEEERKVYDDYGIPS